MYKFFRPTAPKIGKLIKGGHETQKFPISTFNYEFGISNFENVYLGALRVRCLPATLVLHMAPRVPRLCTHVLYAAKKLNQTISQTFTFLKL